MHLPEDFYKFCRRVHGLAAPVETNCSILHLESTKCDLSPCQTHFFQEDVFPFYNYKLCLQKYVPPKQYTRIPETKFREKKGWRIQAVERQLSLVLILFAAGLTFPQAGFLDSVIRF